MSARELQLLSVWHMKEQNKRQKVEAEEEDSDDAATVVLSDSEEEEEEEYTVSAIEEPYLSGSGHLFCKEIAWRPTWEPYVNLPDGWLSEFRSGTSNHRIKQDDPSSQRAKVSWPNTANASIERILHEFPNSMSAAQVDAAWRQASSADFMNNKYSALDKTGPEKAQSNQNFADAVSELGNSGAVVYLEEREANTTNYLRPVTANPLVAVNIDPVVLSNAIICGGENLTTFTGPLSAYLANCPMHSIAAIFADYCCTFAGNSNGLSPAHIDLPLLFGKNLLQHGSVFAMVVCTRFGPVKKKIMKQDIVPFIQALATRYRYRTEMTHSFTYGSMFSLQMKVWLMDQSA